MTAKEAIERIVLEKLKTQVVTGRVVSVDEVKTTCEVAVEGSPNFIDVRLRSVIDSEDMGVLIVPEHNSYVLVGMIENKKQSAFICGFGKVAKVRLITNDIELSGNAFGGLIKIDALISKINALESAVNTLSSLHTAHTHPSPPAPVNPVVTSVPSVPSTVNLVLTQKSELENTKVKHG